VVCPLVDAQKKKHIPILEPFLHGGRVTFPHRASFGTLLQLIVIKEVSVQEVATSSHSNVGVETALVPRFVDKSRC